MMEIKIKLTDDEIITKINGTLKEIAQYYFPRKEVVEIEILDGGVMNDTEYCTTTATRIYRASEEEVKEFQLWNNIRYEYSVSYKTDCGIKDHTGDAGLCRIA